MTPHEDVYPLLLDISRDSVRQLDEHPVAGRLIDGTIQVDSYKHYLAQVVHQVSGSAKMLREAGLRLRRSGAHGPLAKLLLLKSGEEDGHDRWALDDLQSLGVESAAALAIPACPAVRAYRAYTRHLCDAAPIGVLGVAFVLEWFGYSRATRAANNLVARSEIPGMANAVSFLRKHGDADQQHIRTLGEALRSVRLPQDCHQVLLAAQVVASLYADFFSNESAARGSSTAQDELLGVPMHESKQLDAT
jgi:thiaminase